ncbi:MAG: hypothetical protein Q9201_005487 [Fulgogasparrea decipioides]
MSVLLWCYSIRSIIALSPPLNYTAPEPPEGFTTHIGLGQKLLNPIAVYLCAIQAVDQWAGPPWDSNIAHNDGLVNKLLHVGLSYSIEVPRGSAPPLKLSYLLLGLYESVIVMTDETMYREMSVQLEFRGSSTASLGWHHFSGSRPNVGSRIPPNTTAQNRPTSGNVSASNADSGRVSDPNYPDLVLEWKFNERRLDASEVYTAILDLVVDTAALRITEQHPYVDGVSSRRNTALHIQTMVRIQSAQQTNQLVRQAMVLLAIDVFAGHRKFVETDFDILWKGRKTATGWFLKLGNTQGNETTGVSSER